MRDDFIDPYTVLSVELCFQGSIEEDEWTDRIEIDQVEDKRTTRLLEVVYSPAFRKLLRA